MSSSAAYEHKQLFRKFLALHRMPEDEDKCESWIKSTGHLDFLRQDITNSELTVHATSQRTIVHVAIVKEDWLNSVDRESFFHWQLLGMNRRAAYASNPNSEDVQLENNADFGFSPVGGANQYLVFRRCGELGEYIEILQEYLHATDIHFHSAKGAYCRFDDDGDREHVVSLTLEQGEPATTLVSFKREPLDEFMSVSKSVLVRMYDFMFLRPSNSKKREWPDDPPPVTVNGNNDLIYEQQVMPGYGSWTRGIQLLRPRLPRYKIYESIRGDTYKEPLEYVKFTAWDWRNGNGEAIVSTDPQATTNYFDQTGTLPFEISPVFFDPEVLRKYKNDHDKYPRHRPYIQCRNMWTLPYHVNDAGQVQVYIKDLSKPPTKRAKVLGKFQ